MVWNISRGMETHNFHWILDIYITMLIKYIEFVFTKPKELLSSDLSHEISTSRKCMHNFVPLWIDVCISASMLWSCLSHVRDIISPLRYVARICHNDSCGIRNTRSQSDKTYHQKSRSLEAAIFGLRFSTGLKFDYNRIACQISEKCEEVNVKFQSITKI